MLAERTPTIIWPPTTREAKLVAYPCLGRWSACPSLLWPAEWTKCLARRCSVAMAKVKRGHHTVPRFYLEGFVNEDHQLRFVKLSTKKRFHGSLSNTTVVKDFYNIDSRADPNVVENLLADIEGDAAEVFRKVLVEQHWPLHSNNRTVIATFLALQRTRTPSHRAMVDEIGQIIAGIARERGIAPPAEIDHADTKTVRVQSMLNIESHAPHYLGKSWWLVQFRRKRLLTCDSPVGLLPHPDAPDDAGLGIGTAWMMLFPMSPTVGLLMVTPDEDDRPKNVTDGMTDIFVDGTAYFARLFNETMIDNARDSIIRHPDDGDLVPAELPEPRTTQLAAEECDGFG